MKVLFACGGTGGHIYPAIALYHEFVEHDTGADNAYVFVGSDYGLEKDIFRAEGIPDYRLIASRGIARSFSLRTFKSVWCDLIAFSQAKKIVRDLKPDLIVSTGGYPCFHTTYYASKYQIPFFFIEGNVLPGIVVKLFQKRAERIFVSTDLVRKYLKTDAPIRVTGIPTRQAVIHRSKTEIVGDLGFVGDKKLVTIIGGSCGSPELNVAVSGLIKDARLDYQILWATGKKDYQSVRDHIGDIPDHIKVVDYIDNMPEILSVTDMLVSRSGALTIQEIKDHHLPAILVPFAKAAENHQYINASALVALGAARMIEEKDLDSALLRSAIDDVLQNEIALKDAYKNDPAAKSEGAGEKIYREIMSGMKGNL